MAQKKHVESDATTWKIPSAGDLDIFICAVLLSLWVGLQHKKEKKAKKRADMPRLPVHMPSY